MIIVMMKFVEYGGASRLDAPQQTGVSEGCEGVMYGLDGGGLVPELGVDRQR